MTKYLLTANFVDWPLLSLQRRHVLSYVRELQAKRVDIDGQRRLHAKPARTPAVPWASAPDSDGPRWRKPSPWSLDSLPQSALSDVHGSGLPPRDKSRLRRRAFGQHETTQAFPDRVPRVIPHGVDTRAFRPLPERASVRRAARKALGIAAEATLICAVASNNVRKDLARTLAAFAEYRALHDPSAVLYVHTRPFSYGIDLNAAAAALGLIGGQHLFFPASYHPLSGLLDAAMNELYNASDVYFSTTLGEGWGLPVTEAMAAGLPVVAPRHSSLAELGAGGRAVLFECEERIWVDNSGYRPFALMGKVVGALHRALSLSEQERAAMVGLALEFAHRLDWSLVAPRWVSLIDEVTQSKTPHR